MPKIAVLQKHTIDQIAAGEVVERPASVVKELLENAIDAGATAVTVEIRDGGLKKIRVTDNGSGIPADEVETAFLRHATSKLRTVADLDTIASLGFRGEALSSIAAVARVTCVTKTADTLSGTLLRIEAGTSFPPEEIGAPEGTTLVVEDLFFHTPARKKFLLSAGAETARVRVVAEELALSHPEIALHFTADGRTQLLTNGNGEIRDIIFQIYGKETAANLIPFQEKGDGFLLHGYLGTAQIARGNRARELFFVNRRAVKSDLLSRALEEGYHGYLMQHRYPFTVFFVDIDGSAVDVNVHPAKREVRFRNPDVLSRAVTRGVAAALQAREHIPALSLQKQKADPPGPLPQAADIPEPFEHKRREQLSLFKEEPSVYTKDKPGTAAPTAAEPGTAAPTADDAPGPEKEILPETERPVLHPSARSSMRLLGQVFDTYWLMEYEDKLYIVDQHAAHEKVLYERLMKAFREKKVQKQMLYPAIILEPGPGEADRLREREPVFAALGFTIEEFGGGSFKISSVPANLFRTDPQALLIDLMDEQRVSGDLPAEQITERLASMACKAAVKGNHALSFAEAEALFDELLTLENPYHCPHGRPTIITMTRQELDRSFKRIV